MQVLSLIAEEAGCSAVVFLRDRDRDETRERALRQGVAEARDAFSSVSVAAGIVIECLEAWLLAIDGVRRSEGLSVAKAKTELKSCRSTDEMVAWVEARGVVQIPEDAHSLIAWCDEVRSALTSIGGESST